jgi:hypothetical protein
VFHVPVDGKVFTEVVDFHTREEASDLRASRYVQ